MSPMLEAMLADPESAHSLSRHGVLPSMTQPSLRTADDDHLVRVTPGTARALEVLISGMAYSLTRRYIEPVRFYGVSEDDYRTAIWLVLVTPELGDLVRLKIHSLRSHVFIAEPDYAHADGAFELGGFKRYGSGMRLYRHNEQGERVPDFVWYTRDPYNLLSY